MSEIRLKNAVTAFEALSEALGNDHYATLDAAYTIALELIDENKDAKEIIPYAEMAYNGLKNRLGEMSYHFSDIAIVYANALFETEQYEKAIEVCDYTADNFTSIDDEDQEMDIEDIYEVKEIKAHSLMALDEVDKSLQEMKSLLDIALEEDGITEKVTHQIIFKACLLAASAENLDFINAILEKGEEELENSYLPFDEDEEKYYPEYTATRIFLSFARAIFTLPPKDGNNILLSIRKETEEVIKNCKELFDEGDYDEVVEELSAHHFMITQILEIVPENMAKMKNIGK